MTGIELTLCLLLTTSPYAMTGNPASGDASVPTSQPVRVAELYGTGQSFRNVPALKQRVTAPITDQRSINSAGYGNFNGGWHPTVMAAPHVVLPGVMYEQSYTVPYAHVEQIQTPHKSAMPAIMTALSPEIKGGDFLVSIQNPVSWESQNSSTQPIGV